MPPKNAGNSGPRAGRINAAQTTALLEYMNSHRRFAMGQKFSLGYDGTRTEAEMWLELKSICDPLGAPKTVEQWYTCWRDIKSTESKTIAKRRLERARTGNLPGSMAPPTEREKMVMSITGQDYACGIETVPDTLDETDANQEALRQGIYLVPAGDALEMPLDEDIFSQPEIVQIDSAPSSSVTISTQEVAGNEIEMTSPAAADPFLRRNSLKRKAPTTPKNPKKERIGVQLDAAKKQFEEIAAGQTRAMEMLAAASMKAAEAAETQARVAQQLADIAQVNAETERIRVEAHAANETRMLNVLEALANIMQNKLN